MRVLVVAPHPDDETLGCGGTLLRMAADGARLGWLIVTDMSAAAGYADDRVRRRESEIDEVARLLGFSEVFRLRLPTARLDAIPMQDLVGKFAAAFDSFRPEQVFLPNPSDVHTDHRIAFDAGAACTKWFRHPSVRRVLAYETPSETDFSLTPSSFQPNHFVDIADFLERKLAAMSVYASETGTFPFPRSTEALRALARVRGAASGFEAAEAFQLLRERW
jgi:LmbE family N-acetylglucosaminyl deacetylase